MAPRIRHGVMRVGESFPQHDISQQTPSVWPRIWGRIAPHFQTDWKRAGRIALITLAVIAVVLSSTYIPLAWGSHFRWIGTGPGYWSNCAPGGIPPGSWIWVKKAPTYKVGDFVSYGYRQTYQGQTPESPKPNDPAETPESTVHPVRAVNAQGWVYVMGMNTLNSDPAHWVPPSAINGKVVGVVRWLPECYWRWVSYNFTLKQDRAMLRQKAIWSLSTLTNPLTREGRERNRLRFWIADSAPRPIVLANGSSIVQDLNEIWHVYKFVDPLCHIVQSGLGGVSVSPDGGMVLCVQGSQATVLRANTDGRLQPFCSTQVHPSVELWGTSPVWFGPSTVYAFGLDGNIWVLDKSGARKLLPAVRANAMIRRGERLFAGSMNMVLPPPDVLEGEVEIAK